MGVISRQSRQCGTQLRAFGTQRADSSGGTRYGLRLASRWIQQPMLPSALWKPTSRTIRYLALDAPAVVVQTAITLATAALVNNFKARSCAVHEG